MTIEDWLSTLTPAPPAELRDRMRQLLEDRLGAPVASLPEVLVDSARSTVQQLLAEQRFSRDGALDLLVADAFMTYAFEYAAGRETAADLEALSLRATGLMGELATTHV